MSDPDDGLETLTDDEVQTHRFDSTPSAATDDSDDATDTTDDAADTGDDTGDDSGDVSDTSDDSGAVS